MGASRKGELIRKAEEDSYEVIVTTDQNMRHQQNLAGRRDSNVLRKSLCSGAR